MKSTPEEPQIQSEPKPPFPAQKLPKPGLEADMKARPKYEAPRYKPANKLDGRVALITGGDSGIGRAVAVLFAREGAHVAIACLPSEKVDAAETRRAVEAEGRRCVTFEGDVADGAFCKSLIDQTMSAFGRLDILVSNAAHQNRKESIEKAALPHLQPGAAIIVTGSETGFEGPEALPDYSATKGAIHTLTKSLAKMLAERGIRVNCVAPGPVWTPLNVADVGQSPEKVKTFGQKTALGRPAQPEELAPAYVFLASDADSSFITGEILAVMGGGTAPG